MPFPFRHPWHPHPLILRGEAKFEDDCYICLQGLDGNPFYACVHCEYYVHESCSQLPVQIQHRFHPPDHPLSLCFGPKFACYSCHKTFEAKLRFSCYYCKFDLDVKCALMSDIDTEGKEFIRHSTHQHPLTICGKDGDNPLPLNCFACKQTTSDLIYGCTPCDYVLHKSCAQIPTLVLHRMHPQHALFLWVKFGRCNYCEIYDYNWKYYCRICKFFLDLSCMIESAKGAQNSERSCALCGKQHLDSDSCVDSLYFINQSCIQLPEAIKHEFHSHKPLLLRGGTDFWCDSCHKWFDERSHYGCEECNFRMDVKCALMPSIQYEESDESICPVVPPPFKHQHPLRQIREVDEITCSACRTTRLSPIYGCIKCEYFLHQSCLELPIQIQHPLHNDHELILQHFRYNSCKICYRDYDGFAFGCIQCFFFIGIECIFELGPTVEYKYHPHLLYLIEKSYLHGCNSFPIFCQLYQRSSEFELTESYSLRCIECDYNLHFLCGPLPCTIKHKSHLHALKLMDSIVEDYSDEHYCDVCEEIRNPRLCVYYCEDCKFFAHVHCVISEIINVFKKNLEKVELRIVGDVGLEDTINSSHDNLTRELLLDILKRLDANDMYLLTRRFPYVELFPSEEDKRKRRQWKRRLINSSSEDDTVKLIEELSFYNDDIFSKIDERMDFFELDTDYHIELNECKLPTIEVQGYKVTCDSAALFRALLKKYGDFGHHCECTASVKSVLIYFLCRVLESMNSTVVVDVTEKLLFTWIYYAYGVDKAGLDLNFLFNSLRRIIKSYYGLQAMKFEDEAPYRLDCEIVNLEQKIYDIKTQIEELKLQRQQHRVGKIAEESAIMREFFSEAKQLKWVRASEGIF